MRRKQFISWHSRRRQVGIMFLLGMVISLTGCYLYPREEQVLAPPLLESPKISYDTVEAKKGSIEKKVTVNGTFTSYTQQNLAFKNRGGVLKAINVKLGDKVNKGAVLAELDTDDLQSQIKQQEISVEISRLDYENRKTQANVSGYDLQKAELIVKSAQLKLEELKRDYSKAVLTADISGVVVFIDGVSPGDNVSANKTIITIADPSKLYVQYKGDNASEFQVGRQVTVKYASQDFQGQVVASPYSAPSDSSKDLKSVVFVKLDKLPEGAAIGGPADITLVKDKRENVIVIPKNVITSSGDKSTVQVLDKGIKYERNIEIGVQTSTEAEIVNGLKEGDKVILR